LRRASVPFRGSLPPLLLEQLHPAGVVAGSGGLPAKVENEPVDAQLLDFDEDFQGLLTHLVEGVTQPGGVDLASAVPLLKARIGAAEAGGADPIELPMP
jgi:hypothetical protein